MPALIRGMARTAVIAGTATATSNAVNRRMAQGNVDAYAGAANQYQQENQQPANVAVAPVAGGAAYAVPTAPVGGGEDQLAQLERLAQLKAQGILTDEEFAAQKAKILGL